MTRFLQSNRSDIGLVDRFDLSEIYTQDSRFALSNILLDPDGLDQIFGLSSDGLTREDIRTAGGLDRPVIHSLGIADQMLSAVSFDLSQRITTDKAVGEPGKHSFTTNSRSDNIIVFSGGIAANKIEYNFLDESGEVRTTTVPTSRESLFDSIKDDEGRFTTASYPGLFRIRRRSHVNEIKLDPTLLIERSAVVESPTDLVNLPIYMRTSNNPDPSVTLVSAYATKNSPIILPVRISSTASISFSRATANASSPAFVYGWELRRFSDGALVRGQSINSRGNITTANISINVTGTIGAGVNCLLYVYLDPGVIVSANLSGIGLTELLGGQDIGLVGFNSLRELDISGNNLSTVPVWLKTLYAQLQLLNIRGNTFWNNGIVSYFDYQDLRTSGITGANTSINPPNITLSQVLGYSGWRPNGSRVSGYDGDFATIQDTFGRLYKDARANSISGTTPVTTNLQNGFRPFSQLTDLNIGPNARLVNPDFSRLFPALRNLTIDRPSDKSPAVLWGLIPKLNNNKGLMSINISGHEGNVGGSIKYLGNTLEWDESEVGWTTAKADQFIGQFQITNLDINRRDQEGISIGNGYFGGVCTDSSDVPNVTVDGAPKYHHIQSGTVAEAWSGWLSRLQQFRSRRNDIAFKIAKGNSLVWNNLRIIDLHWMGNYGTRNKVEYNKNLGVGQLNATDILNAASLTNVQAWRSGWWGKIFSIREAKSLTNLNLGANEWLGYEGPAGEEFLLPENFVPTATTDSFSNLQFLYLHYLWAGGDRNLELKTTDLQNLPKLRQLHLTDSFIGGVFPTIPPNNSLTSGVVFDCWLRNSRFRDLRALGSSISSRVGLIWAPLQGSGVGGALLPVFAPLGTNTTLRYVNFNGSLSSRYSGSWGDGGKRGKVITSLAPGQTPESVTPSVTWTSRNNNNTANAVSSKLFHNSQGSYFPVEQITVGDNVESGGGVIGRVTQIDRAHSFIYLDTNVNISNQTLTFRRRGQDISLYFNNHSNLQQVYLDDCKLVGNIPRFVGCPLLSTVTLNSNLLSGYVAGTFQNITGVAIDTLSAPRLRTFNANNNAFTVSAIRLMISDLHAVAVYFSEKNIRVNIRVRLLGTKINTSTGQYQNWTRSEIFNGTSSSGGGNTIPDSLETKFNQLGPGSLYPGITIELF
jgi:hypothetical protein